VSLYERFGGQAEFVLVYIREAHALDGWTLDSGWSIITDPRDDAERKAAAAQTCSTLKLPFTTVVDTMDDAVAERWSAWPERLFVIGRDGRVAYVGAQGPWGFWPAAATPPFGAGPGSDIDTGKPLDTFLEYFLAPAAAAGS